MNEIKEHRNDLNGWIGEVVKDNKIVTDENNKNTNDYITKNKNT